MKDIPDEEVRDYEALRLGVFESLKPKDQMQAILCDKVTIDAWHLRKVLAFEQGAMQLETLKLDASGSPVNFSDRKAIIYNMENNKSESENLNQLKKWLTAKGDANFSDLSNKACWLLEEIVQTFPRKLQAYRRRAFEKL